MIYIGIIYIFGVCEERERERERERVLHVRVHDISVTYIQLHGPDMVALSVSSKCL